MRILVLSPLLLFSVTAALASEAPRVELFGGYSYLRVNSSGEEGLNAHGWNASVAGNVNRWLGFAADFSGHRDSLSLRTFGATLAAADADFHFFLFGPRFTFRRAGLAQPFVHALFGAAKADAGVSSGLFGSFRGGDTAFAAAAGGGLDIRAGDHFAVRVLQADYIYTNFAVSDQDNFRLSTGVVLRFGRAD